MISQELVDELAFSWLEMHKKSALTYLVLQALSERPRWSKDIEAWLEKTTGWNISERVLYRALRRLEKQGVIRHSSEPAKRTGAERKVFSLTAEGEALLITLRDALQYINKIT